MAGKYDHKAIEKKWQKKWEDTQAFKALDDSAKDKNYLLIEFPYPSGDGLHVGHVRSWTALDVVARKHRAEGKNVIYPIGWDAFGLPAENYAIKTGIHPKIVTKQNTDNFRRQIKSIGISFDWSREINTTDPAYYKWTQWIFLQMFKQGLAYKAKIPVNWCPKDKIVLANEEVVDGCCERCGTPVEKREKEQWMLAITKYAKRLYDDLDTVDYIERAKVQQKNWIGPSEGAEIEFAVAGSDQKIKVFTTRPDTLFGATYMVLAPEHPLVKEFAQKAENKAEIEAYVAETKNKAEIDRTAEGKEKTGVELKGVKAINPANHEEVPIFIADYVLGNYGTGAIMAVPAHDERDGAFAKKFNLPIKQVVAPYTVVGGTEAPKSEENIVKFDAATAIIKHWSDPDLYYVVDFSPSVRGFVGGHVEDGETPEQTATREATEESGYTDIKKITQIMQHAYSRGYKTRKQREEECHDALFLVELGSDARNEIVDKETKQGGWVTSKEILQLSEKILGHHGLFFESHFYNKPFTGAGKLVDSGEFGGLMSEEAKKKITEAVGGKLVTTYKLRDWVFSRQRYWGEPIPMIHCDKDGWVPVPEEQLPVELPQVEKYQPTDNGESPLAGMHEWVNTICPKCGGEAKRETDVMPNWAGSSWYYLRYTDPANNTAFASPEKLKYWTPVDWYNGGMEHTVLHLLYSRFWHKFLFDQKLVPTSEPYMKRTSHGLIMAKDGSKMSKSKGNTVSPDEIVETYGADSLRLYEMFIGPFDQPVAWNTEAIIGVHRFLERVWKLEISDAELSEDNTALLNQTIKKVGEDIEGLKLNTAVSSMMILLNALEPLPAVPKPAYKTLVTLLAPFAPHMASELWEKAELGGDISAQAWPTYDAAQLTTATTKIGVQVNGKVRGSIEVPQGMSEGEVLAMARQDPSVAKWLALGKEQKAVYVAGRIISFAVSTEPV